jgi:polyisoprenoid-binding protein YceI
MTRFLPRLPDHPFRYPSLFPLRPGSTSRRRPALRDRVAARALAWGLAGVLASFASTPAAAQAARFEIDPDHLSIGFLVHHISYANVLGMFRSGKGSYSYDEKTGALSDVRIEVETGSVFTNNRSRDDHLKGPDFLNSGEFPKMIFTAATAERSADKTYQVNGNLELLGRQLPMTLQATVNKIGDYEMAMFRKPRVMGVSARGTFKRSPYGMKYGIDNGWVGDDVSMIIEFQAQRR